MFSKFKSLFNPKIRKKNNWTYVFILLRLQKYLLPVLFSIKVIAGKKGSWWHVAWNGFQFSFSTFFQCRDCVRVDLKDLSCYSWIKKNFALMLLFSYWYFVALCVHQNCFLGQVLFFLCKSGQTNCLKRFQY